MAKKTYCKIIEIESKGSEPKKILLDPVFGSKIELIYDSESKGTIPETDTYVNVIHEGTKLIEIIAEEVKPEEEKKPALIPLKKTTPTGPTREVSGTLIETTVSEEGQIRSGTITVKLQDMDLKMMVGPRTQGDIPKVGSIVTVTMEDLRLPRIITMRITDPDHSLKLAYTPVPKSKGGVRWPKACMSCGSFNFDTLKKKTDLWKKAVERSEWRKEAREKASKERVIKIIEDGVKAGRKYDIVGGLMAATIAAGTTMAGHGTRTEFELVITAYYCTACYDKKIKVSRFMNIEIIPDTTRFEFEFASPKYAEIFIDLNPGHSLKE